MWTDENLYPGTSILHTVCSILLEQRCRIDFGRCQYSYIEAIARRVQVYAMTYMRIIHDEQAYDSEGTK